MNFSLASGSVVSGPRERSPLSEPAKGSVKLHDFVDLSGPNFRMLMNNRTVPCSKEGKEAPNLPSRRTSVEGAGGKRFPVLGEAWALRGVGTLVGGGGWYIVDPLVSQCVHALEEDLDPVAALVEGPLWALEGATREGPAWSALA